MKYLASDFDGTLYFKNTEFRKSDLEAINRFQKEGNQFGICTGRARQGIDLPTGDLIHYDFYIVNSGALILDRNKNILFQKHMNRDAIEGLISHVIEDKDLLHFNLTSYEHRYYIVGDSGRYNILSKVDGLRDISEDILSISTQFPTTAQAQALTDWIGANLSEQLSAYCNVNSVDIVCKGCSKGSGIRFIRDYFSIDSGSMSGIGDADNDLPMLQEVDTSFTFHASEQTVRDAADVCVDSVAECIQHLMKLQ